MTLHRRMIGNALSRMMLLLTLTLLGLRLFVLDPQAGPAAGAPPLTGMPGTPVAGAPDTGDPVARAQDDLARNLAAVREALRRSMPPPAPPGTAPPPAAPVPAAAEPGAPAPRRLPQVTTLRPGPAPVSEGRKVVRVGE
jgi:hypothetical protein